MRRTRTRCLPAPAAVLVIGLVLWPAMAASQEKDQTADPALSTRADKPFAGERKPLPARPEGQIMELTSPAFADGKPIPVKHTCDGKDLSPELVWSGVPELTRAFVVICDDPDAPVGTWDHWVLFDIPAEVRTLPEGIRVPQDLPRDTLEGKNSWGRTGWGGPCPPPGKPHRYIFRLYALKVPLGLEKGAAKKEVLAAMEGLVLAEAELVGTYQRNR